MKFRHIIYTAISIPSFLILIWFFAIHENLITEKIEGIIAKSGNRNISLEVKQLKKGVFFSLNAESLLLKFDGKDALEITDFHARFAPGYLTDGKVAFKLTGKIGKGDLVGIIKLPADGKIVIDSAALDAIPYITRFITDIDGHFSSDIDIKDSVVKTEFEIPDLNIKDSALTIIPLINTFRKIQGAITLKGNNINIDSLSLEGEKGYARLKGHITNGLMDLLLELMPATDRLNAAESMLIGKYIISPGYYVVPIKRAMPNK